MRNKMFAKEFIEKIRIGKFKFDDPEPEDNHTIYRTEPDIADRIRIVKPKSDGRNSFEDNTKAPNWSFFVAENTNARNYEEWFNKNKLIIEIPDNEFEKTKKMKRSIRIAKMIPDSNFYRTIDKMKLWDDLDTTQINNRIRLIRIYNSLQR